MNVAAPHDQQARTLTVRIGVFFDGTGNNRDNSRSTAQCRAWSSGAPLDDASAGFCRAHGFDAQGKMPHDSYGNEPSNIAYLYELYRDQAEEVLGPEQGEVSLAVYVEGVGTTRAGPDSLYAQGTGRWGTGVLARVAQTPAKILQRLAALQARNPGLVVGRLVFDLFGFSRGAAEARHFANDLLKGAKSLLAIELAGGAVQLAGSFAWRRDSDISLNFIGLFDTVAAIVSPLVGNFRPGNDVYGRLALGLAKGDARRVVQLVAADEQRENFALVASDDDILLPGVHADLGGGYLAQMHEQVLLSRPDRCEVNLAVADEQSPASQRVRQVLETQARNWQARGLMPALKVWSQALPFDREEYVQPVKRVFAAVQSEREVLGQLSRVYLRVMRELAVVYDVPLASPEGIAALALPDELLEITEKLQAFALGQTPRWNLCEQEQHLLYSRYVHCSAHWGMPGNTSDSRLEALYLNRPASAGRAVHGNR
ncbi:T6SS phospholipase effector Tle1-like catalytic domain-containing protein [Pseudomonas fontis]|uniref:DUF2235 domain-containing protein n=1 Tax=Pseudomonas fontis TaxID=2942633 RepID=A0ABT5NVR2_9PSED|nr:DUF2235 domain-containing protein [Pseudomonas fontis]MDD0975254.1 DUF2235 domain-containing protein [Pseudomonas fontis]MDD0992224.1 DUF2235 domain-containing protein [Pseudomonas fontis]